MLDIDRVVALVGRSNPTILDIGANNGGHSNLFAKHFPYAQIFSFEPDPRANARFESKVRNPRIHLTKKAVGEGAGHIQFYQSSGTPPNAEQGSERWAEGWDLSGSIKRPTGTFEVHPWVKFEKTIDVEVISLDQWAAEHDVKLIDFIWSDVQGAQAELIKGGRATLAGTRYFYTEYAKRALYEGEPDLNAICALLPEFEIVEVFKADVLLKNTKFPAEFAMAQ